MKALHRRVVTARGRVAGLRIAAPEPPAMVQWVAILKRVLPALEASNDPTAPAAAARIHRTVALVAQALVSGRPWAYLEYYCHACVLRMHWPSHAPAYRDPDYDKQIDGIEGIERTRNGPPRMINLRWWLMREVPTSRGTERASRSSLAINAAACHI